MGKRIIQLSEQTINQIAAGEVIEDPASVVKELVENALDAGATAIRVEILGSGFQLIRISDNGEGMDESALRLCLERHATSKISSLADLETISSMGFRGEALASINAIAKVEIVSAVEGREGLRLVAGSLYPEARQRVTTIDVKQLFYNVPARQKFQKSPSACQAEITKWMMRLSLAFPLVAFSLIAEGKEVFSVEERGLGGRIKQLLGESFWKQLIPVEYAKGGIRIEGFIASPEHTRQNRSGQYFFVNQRILTSSPLPHALQIAYGTLIPPKTHPPCVLHFSIPSTEIDINVHPQKREVRMLDEGKIRSAVDGAVRGCWRAPAPVFVAPNLPSTPFVAAEVDFIPSAATAQALPIEVKIEVLGVLDCYALVKSEEGVVVFDLVAASQRIFFEKAEKSTLGVERLLFPKHVEVTLDRAGEIEQDLSQFIEIGVELRPFGPKTFLIEGVAKYLDLQQVVEMLQEWRIGASRKQALLACSAIKRRGFSRFEAEAILNELKECELPLVSPLGGPTRVVMTYEEIRKRFS